MTASIKNIVVPVTISEIKLVRLDDSAFSKATDLYKSDSVRNLTTDYYNYLFTSALNYLESGDVNIVNNLTNAARFVGRVRVTQQCIDLFTCHKRGKNGLFNGRMNKDNRDLLLLDVDKLESSITQALTINESIKAAKPAKEWNEEAKLKQLAKLVAELSEHGVDQSKITAALSVTVDSVPELKVAA